MEKSGTIPVFAENENQDSHVTIFNKSSHDKGELNAKAHLGNVEYRF